MGFLWRNAGLPVIVGEAYDGPTGSRFEITFRIRKDLLAFLRRRSRSAHRGNRLLLVLPARPPGSNRMTNSGFRSGCTS